LFQWPTHIIINPFNYKDLESVQCAEIIHQIVPQSLKRKVGYGGYEQSEDTRRNLTGMNMDEE